MKAQVQYNKELGRNRKGQNKGVREVREVREIVPEVGEAVREEESEDDGVRMVHIITSGVYLWI